MVARRCLLASSGVAAPRQLPAFVGLLLASILTSVFKLRLPT
jgi:hypothetical protein